MKCRILLLLGMLLCPLLSPVAQRLDKPYSTWSKDDAIKIVSESAWAKTYQSTKGTDAALASQIARQQAQTANSGGSNPRSVARDLGPPPVVMRLHSAMPVRQALVRLQQIDAGYDRMSDADKAAFDKGREKFLECGICKDYYVVTLTKFKDSTGTVVDEGIFQGMTIEDLKGQVKLVNDRGEIREVIQFNAPKNAADQAVFYFKRLDESGKALLTNESKEVRFVFAGDFLTTKNRFAYLVPNAFEFKVSKLIHNNGLLF